MPDVTIYTQPSCGYCNQLKEYLQKHNVKFEDKDITKDRSAWDELINKHKIRATPVLVYGDKKIIGFNPEDVDRALGLDPSGVAEAADAK